MPGETGVTVVTTLVCLFYFACEAAGALSARHSLRPLIQRAEGSNANLARMMRRECEAVSPRHCLRQTQSVCAREHLRRSNPFFLCAVRWIASLTLAMTASGASG